MRKMASNDLELAHRLSTCTEMGEATGKVLEMVRSLRVPFQSCVVLLRGKNGRLVPVLSETPYRDVLAMSSLLELRETVIDTVLESHTARLDFELPENSEGRIFKDERSVVCLPLIAGEACLGVLYVGAVATGTHTLEHLDMLEDVANLAAPVLASLFPVEKLGAARAPLQDKTAQLDALQELGRKLSTVTQGSEIGKIVSVAVRKAIPETQSVILFLRDTEDPTGRGLKAVSTDTPFADYVHSLAPRDNEGILAKAIELGCTVLVPDTEMYDVPNLLGAERSVVVAPLLAGDEEARGTLYVGSVAENTLTEEHRRFIEIVSYQAVMALNGARLYEQTQQMALTDGLTGLYTHRLFQDKLEEEVEYAAQHDQFIVLVMLDADNFLPYNQTLGYAAGDALLKEIAALLKDKVRPSDIVCRYGGDEFALLLKNTRKEDAARMCERIREAFQLRFGSHQIQVTASIGLACFPTDADSKEDLMRAADDALYVTKRGGRNRVSVSPDLQNRRRGPIGGGEPPWDHPHTSPRKPPPKNVPGGGSQKLG